MICDAREKKIPRRNIRAGEYFRGEPIVTGETARPRRKRPAHRNLPRYFVCPARRILQGNGRLNRYRTDHSCSETCTLRRALAQTSPRKLAPPLSSRFPRVVALFNAISRRRLRPICKKNIEKDPIIREGSLAVAGEVFTRKLRDRASERTNERAKVLPDATEAAF